MDKQEFKGSYLNKSSTSFIQFLGMRPFSKLFLLNERTTGHQEEGLYNHRASICIMSPQASQQDGERGLADVLITTGNSLDDINTQSSKHHYSHLLEWWHTGHVKHEGLAEVQPYSFHRPTCWSVLNTLNVQLRLAYLAFGAMLSIRCLAYGIRAIIVVKA